MAARKSAKYLICAHSFHWPDYWHREDKDRRTPTGLCNSYWGPADSALGTYQRVASPESLGCAHCRPSVRGGFKETRDCKEIKILFQPVLPALGARTSYLNWRSEPHEISAEFVFCCPGLQHNGPLVSWKTSYLSVGGPPTPLKTLGAIHKYNIIVHV